MKWIAFVAALLVAYQACGKDEPGNRPYVQSGPDGVLYAGVSRT
jgi:hypothetical protein